MVYLGEFKGEWLALSLHFSLGIIIWRPYYSIDSEEDMAINPMLWATTQESQPAAILKTKKPLNKS
ncbi:MAG: hypothetical protein WDO16_09080 [Bacteroidota bacterium]